MGASTKRAFLTVVLFAAAATASAQIHSITTTRSRYGGTSSFSIGPRLSNYSTDINAGPAPLETGRQSSFGVAGDWRSNNFVLDFSFDHDPENGINLSDIIIDTGNYARDRGEATIGFAIAPILDLQGGIRFDTIRIGGASFFGTPFLSPSTSIIRRSRRGFASTAKAPWPPSVFTSSDAATSAPRSSRSAARM